MADRRRHRTISPPTRLEAATFVATRLLPAMASVREADDTLETPIADDVWPLPTYQEMLYIR